MRRSYETVVKPGRSASAVIVRIARSTPEPSFHVVRRLVELPVVESHVTFTHAEFVLDVANQDGAHCHLNEKYARLTRQNALGVTIGGLESPSPLILYFLLTIPAWRPQRTRALPGYASRLSTPRRFQRTSLELRIGGC